MTHRYQLTILVVLLLALSGFLAWRVTHRAPTVAWQTEAIESLTLTFERPADLTVTPLTEQDKEKSIDFRAESIGAAAQPYLLTIRHEDGLRLPISLTKQEMIPMLLSNSEKSFPGRFPEFTKVSSDQFELDQHKAGEILFTYKSPAGSRTKQRFIIIDKDGNTVVYVALQAKESDYDQLNQQIFQKMIDSINLN